MEVLVMSTNAAVQGCSMSIIMVNSMFSVLAHHISAVSPSVSLANFIDDCKVWSSERHHGKLQEALNEIQSFDAAVGQVLNVGETAVMSRFRKHLGSCVMLNSPFIPSMGVSLSDLHNERPGARLLSYSPPELIKPYRLSKR